MSQLETNFDQDLWRHVASQGHNMLTKNRFENSENEKFILSYHALGSTMLQIKRNRFPIPLREHTLWMCLIAVFHLETDQTHWYLSCLKTGDTKKDKKDETIEDWWHMVPYSIDPLSPGLIDKILKQNILEVIFLIIHVYVWMFILFKIVFLTRVQLTICQHK